ncbi:MAG: iron-sulfur cluster assembly scaffold protein [Candidatus Acidiferrum sp.]
MRQMSFGQSCKARRELGYDSGMYSELVLEHFRNPRNAGKLADATVQVQTTNPVCGDILELAVRVENGGIAEARFLCRGCTTAIACSSLLTVRLTGCSVAEARSITAENISEGLGGLPPATFHGAQLAIDALSLLLEKLH